MHEYALMQGIVAAIQDKLAAENVTAPVLEVELTIGMLDIHSEAAARQAFEVLTRNTPLERATLTLNILPATLTCPACSHREPFLVDHFHSHDPVPLVDCPRCGQAAHLTGGRGVGAIEVTLAGEEET